MTTRPRGGCCSQPSESRQLIDHSTLSSKNYRILRYHCHIIEHQERSMMGLFTTAT